MSPYDHKHYVTPRSFKEATGKFYAHDESKTVEEWLWMVVICLGYLVCFLTIVEVI